MKWRHVQTWQTACSEYDFLHLIQILTRLAVKMTGFHIPARLPHDSCTFMWVQLVLYPDSPSTLQEGPGNETRVQHICVWVHHQQFKLLTYWSLAVMKGVCCFASVSSSSQSSITSSSTLALFRKPLDPSSPPNLLHPWP